MSDIRYTEDHEWVVNEGDNRARVGITDYAQDQLGELVFIELPEVGSEVSQGDAIAVIESVKSASDLISPVSGKVVEVNEKLYDQPELVNEDPYGEGWFFAIEASNPEEYEKLLTPEQYAEKIKED